MEFDVYDVFSDTPFGGNQLAVFPDASELSEDLLQSVAREFNFSETVFAFPAETSDGRTRLRIFTPTAELPFAGHPLIGAAVALAEHGGPAAMVIELPVGPVAVAAEGGAAMFEITRPLVEIAEPAETLVAACAGLDAGALVLDTHAPVMAGVGLPFAIAEVSSDALTEAQPAVAEFRRALAAHPTETGFPLFLYAREGDEVRARMFAPLAGIPEDPATGSACAALGALLRDRLGADQSLDIRQGVEMGRPARIGVQARDGAVTVSGQAVRTMTGRLTL